MNKYCTKCGYKHEYTFDAPSFCESCGNPFGQMVAAKAAPARSPAFAVTSPAIRRMANEDDAPLPNISKLDVTIETEQASKITVLSAKDAPHLGEARPQGTKFNYKDVEQELAQQFARDRANTREEISSS